MRKDLPSGSVTFLFTDVEGSTRLLHEHGERYAELLAEHRRLLRAAFDRDGGVEVDTQGDAFFVAFADAPAAAHAALEAQRALAATPVRVRIGIHTGEPQVTPEGYVGLDVHRAARIAAAGHGGQVLISDRTRRLLDEQLPVVDLGLHRLRDVGEPVKLFQLGGGSFPPPKTLNATNLPSESSPLVGRERELRELRELIGSGVRLVTVTGPGGAGKTRLALQAAAESVAGFVDGVFWAPLQTLREPGLVLPTVAQALGAKVSVAEHVGERRILLLLDNLEQLLPAAAAPIAELLGACPQLVLVVTSRAPLRIAGEHEYELGPLTTQDAVALFRARAAISEPEAAVVQICRRLDGLPLAVELAAARTRLLSPQRLLERLQTALPLLTGGPRDAPERQRTLISTIAWSHDLLSQEEQRLFRRLSVFAGGFELEAAEQVAEADLDTLESLVEKSLVRPPESDRLAMLETIREYAAERLEEAGEAEQLRRRHADYFLRLFESANLFAEAEGPQRHALVIRDRDNARAAIDRARAAGDSELAADLAVALENFWVTHDPYEGIRLFAGLVEADGLSPARRARLLRAFAAANESAGNPEQGRRLYEESLALARGGDDPRATAILLYRLGQNALRLGEPGRAKPLLEQALELFRGLESRRGEAQALGSLGSLARAEGDTERAAALFERSATLAAEIGRTWWEAQMRLELADLALQDGQPAEAAVRAREALRLAEEMRDRQGFMHGLACLAVAAAESGDARIAGRLWGAIESAERQGPLGAWESKRDDYARRLRACAGAELEQGLAEGWHLSLDDAVAYGLERTRDP